MKAGDVADEAVCVKRNDTLACARKLMLRHKARKLVVVDGGRPVGVLSAKDFLLKIKSGPLWKMRPVDNLLVSSAMTADPIVALADSDVSDIARTMLENKVSSIPLTGSDGLLVGMVTKEAVLRAFLEVKGKKQKVSDFMAKDVFSVGSLHTLSHVKKTLQAQGIGRVVVKDKEFPIGIITATDVLFAELGDPVAGIKVRRKNLFRRSEGSVKEKVEETQPLAGDMMAGDLVTISAKDDVVKAAEVMLKHDISSLPVVGAGGVLVGIITKTDIVRAFLEREG